jgi:hypothetical protein
MPLSNVAHNLLNHVIRATGGRLCPLSMLPNLLLPRQVTDGIAEKNLLSDVKGVTYYPISYTYYLIYPDLYIVIAGNSYKWAI